MSDGDVHVEEIPYGRTRVRVRIPTRNYLCTLAPPDVRGVPDGAAAIAEALENPIGTGRLRAIAAGKRTAAIVVNDVTRPTPTRALLPPVLHELKAAGIGSDRTTILVATGLHRESTAQELADLLGDDVVRDCRVLSHDCRDEGSMVYLGETTQGVPVAINRLFREADVRVLLGSVAPHQTAGFTGGRKSVLPGIAALETLGYHHGPTLRATRPVLGELSGNRFHESAVEAAGMAGVHFILNVVQNLRREITHVVAGDVVLAWLEGVRMAREVYEVDVTCPADIVIASPGGFPRDIDLYQAQKAMAAAELMVKDGGTVILPAECRDGVGEDGFYKYLADASSPQAVIDRFSREGFSVGANKAWLFSRCLARATVIVVTGGISDDVLHRMFTKRADTVEVAMEMAVAEHGSTAKALLVIGAADMIPRSAARDRNGACRAQGTF